jgi:hypothetical protein
VNALPRHDDMRGVAALPLPHNIEAEQELLGAGVGLPDLTARADQEAAVKRSREGSCHGVVRT